MVRAWVPLLISSLLAPAESLEQTIQHIIASSPAFSGGFVGVRVVELKSGKVLADINGDRLFVPASNTKLFSTSMALSRLGPDYRFVTRVVASGAPDASGRLDGDLVFVGGGDPTMSNRRMPYDRDPALAVPMEPVNKLADEIASKGVRVITGDIVGDDSAYIWEPYPPGWAEDDTMWEYGSPVSALTFNHNCVVVGVRGGKNPGERVKISPDPPLEYFVFDNQLETVAGGESKVTVERSTGSREVTLRGQIVAGAEIFPLWLAIDDPPLYAATALYQALTRKGITVRGHPVSRHRWPGDPPIELPKPELARRESAPLIEILRVTDKISSNLWAEIAMREVARSRGGTGTREGGLKELHQFLGEVGLRPDDYSFSDASGLSRLTLIKPEAVVRLLAFLNAGPHGALWRGVLPVGGVDGTLMNRFPGESSASRIQAKTGSLTHVSALSGYAVSSTYGDLAFSILVNNTVAAPEDVRSTIDRIGLALIH